MTAPRLASRVMRARRESVCPLCREPVRIGQLIALTTKWAHAGCVVASLYKTSGEDPPA